MTVQQPCKLDPFYVYSLQRLLTSLPDAEQQAALPELEQLASKLQISAIEHGLQAADCQAGKQAVRQLSRALYCLEGPAALGIRQRTRLPSSNKL